MNRYTFTLITAVASAASLFFLDGDQLQSTLQNTVQSMASPVENATSEEAVADEKANLAVEVSGDEEHAEREAKPESKQLAFEPPFPDRLEMFQAPKRQDSSRRGDTGQMESAVELLGFVNVGGQRVALSIDGFVTTIAEGGEQNGIEVISIQPPSVVLQRGRQRWQASFEN